MLRTSATHPDRPLTALYLLMPTSRASLFAFPAGPGSVLIPRSSPGVMPGRSPVPLSHEQTPKEQITSKVVETNADGEAIALTGLT